MKNKDVIFQIEDIKYPHRLFLFHGQDIKFTDWHATVSSEVAYKIARAQHAPNEFKVLTEERVPFNKDSWKKERRLIWSCNIASANGYGVVAENVIKAMLDLEIDVLNPQSISGDTVYGGQFVDEELKKSLNKKIQPDCLEIQHCQPPALRDNVVERIWIYTMYETTHTPKSWIGMLNKAERVIVPSKWLVGSWKEQGVTRPMSVFNHGVDTRFYKYMKRPEREVYTFLHYGQLSLRKGTDVVVKAFRAAFRPEEKVRLILKTTTPFYPVEFQIPNVEYINATYSKEQMIGLLKEADCLVAPSRGEGFSLPPLEAMATGLPVIITGWSGPEDYIDKKDTLILDYDMVPAEEFDMLYKDFYEPGEKAGYWAEPKVDDLRDYMRWCFDNRAKAKKMGLKASERVLDRFTWQKVTSGLLKTISDHI